MRQRARARGGRARESASPPFFFVLTTLRACDGRIQACSSYQKYFHTRLFPSIRRPCPVRRARALGYEYSFGPVSVPLRAVDYEQPLSYRDTTAVADDSGKMHVVVQRMRLLGWQSSRPLYAVVYVPESAPPLPENPSLEELLERLRAEPPTVRRRCSLRCVLH